MILDTFFILFESDTSKAQKGVKDAEKSAENLEKKVKQTDKALDELGQSFLAVAKSAASAIAAIVSIGAIKEGILNAAEYNNELSRTSRVLGLNANAIEAWGGAVTAAGGNASEFMGTLKSLNDRYMSIGMGGRVPDLFEVLPRLADRFEKLSDRTAFALGRRMGLDDGTVMLLKKGRIEVEALVARMKELTYVNKQDLEIAHKFRTELSNLGLGFRSLFTAIGSDVLPALTWLFEGIQDIVISLRDHKGFVYGFFIGLAAVAGLAAAPLIAAAAPFLLIAAGAAAAATAVALIWDEISQFRQGNASLIGDFVDAFPMMTEILKEVAAAFMVVFNAAAAVAELLVMMLVNPQRAWEVFNQRLAQGWADFTASIPLVKDALGSVGDFFIGMGDKIQAVWQGIKDAILGAVNAVRKVIGLGPVGGGPPADQEERSAAIKKNLGFSPKDQAEDEDLSGMEPGRKDRSEQQPQTFMPMVPEETAQAMRMGQTQIATAAAAPISSQTNSSVSNLTRTDQKTVNLSTGPITVETSATNGDQVANELGKSLSSHFRTAVANFDDGVAY